MSTSALRQKRKAQSGESGSYSGSLAGTAASRRWGPAAVDLQQDRRIVIVITITITFILLPLGSSV